MSAVLSIACQPLTAVKFVHVHFCITSVDWMSLPKLWCAQMSLKVVSRKVTLEVYRMRKFSATARAENCTGQ